MTDQATNETRTLQPGAVVQIGDGKTPWEVTWLGRFYDVGAEHPVRQVHIRSQRSGRTRMAQGFRLHWYGTRTPVDRWPGRRRELKSRQTEEQPPWGSDGCSSAVTEWDAPVNRDGGIGGPSAVTVCRYRDGLGNQFLGIISDGDGERRAFLRADAARELALAIIEQTGDM